MPTDFHLAARPHHVGDSSRWIHRPTDAHVRRHAPVRRTTGHVWQGRLGTFTLQDDHLPTVLRYVERNALRVGLVDRAEAWPFGSLAIAASGSSPVRLAPGPAPRDIVQIARGNEPVGVAKLAAMRSCLVRASPYPTEDWTRRTVEFLGLRSSLRPAGRRGEGRIGVGRP